MNKHLIRRSGSHYLPEAKGPTWKMSCSWTQHMDTTWDLTVNLSFQIPTS